MIKGKITVSRVRGVIGIIPTFLNENINGAPSELTAVAVSFSQIDLSWTIGSTNHVGHKIYISEDGEEFTELDAVLGAENSYSATELEEDTQYWFYVTAYNSHDESDPTNTVDDTTLIDWSSYWTQLFKDYKARVEADGGAIINTTRMSQDVKFLEECGEFDSLVMFESAWGGIKKTASGGVNLIDKWYDLKENDAAQTTAGLKPKLAYVNGNTNYPVIDINYAANAKRRLVHPSLLTNDYTAIYIHKPYSNTGSSVIHGGDLSGTAKLGIYARSATEGRGTGVFSSLGARFSNENPVMEKWRVDTYTPTKIYKDGTEVTYAITANITSGAITTIGDRADATSSPYFGDLVAIIVFNKTIADATRIAIENHFKTKVVDTYPTITPTQLNYVVYHAKDQKIFAGDLVAGKLLYSTNNGTSFTELVFADVANVQMAFMFANGTIFFCTKTKVYKSIDGLQNIVEIQAKGITGADFNPASGDNYEPIHVINSQIVGNDEIICWGNYTLKPNLTRVNIYASVNGADCKIVYAFNSGTYADGIYAARHVHSVAYCESNGYWYACTGDKIESHQIHWLRGIYNDGTWTWEYLFEGNDANKTKGSVISFEGSKILWASDATANPAVTELGVFYCDDVSTITTPSTHQTLFNLPTETGAMCIDDDRMLFAYRRGDTTQYLYVYERATKKISLYVLNISIPGILLISKQSNNRYIARVRNHNINSWLIQF